MKKKSLFALLILMITLIISGCGKNKAEYGEDLRNVADKILENSTKAEDILNQYANIWRYSIESKGSIKFPEMAEKIGLSETDVRNHFPEDITGNILPDFSINVSALNSYFKEAGKLEEIEKTSKEIKTQVSDLKEPPSEHEKAYDELLDLYTYEEEYIEMALNPTGSLQSFNENRDRLVKDILKKYRKIETLIPRDN